MIHIKGRTLRPWIVFLFIKKYVLIYIYILISKNVPIKCFVQEIGEGESIDAYRERENLLLVIFQQDKSREEEVEDWYWKLCKLCNYFSFQCVLDKKKGDPWAIITLSITL